MNWSDDPVLKLESLGQFLTPEERASLLEAENRALREKLSVSEEAIAFLQSHLMTRESRSLQAEGQGRELAELWAAQSAVDERLQTLQDSQTGLVALFRREHERLTQAVNQEAARYLSNTLADSERALADAYARAPQLLLRGLADGNPRAFDEARRLVAEAQARSSEARRAAQESLENRLMTLQDSVTNLLTLFEREVDMMVSDVRSDLAASLPSAYNRRVTERSTAGRQIAGIRPLAEPAAEPEAEASEQAALADEEPAGEAVAESQIEAAPEASSAPKPAETGTEAPGEAEPPAPEAVVPGMPPVAEESAEPEPTGEQPGPSGEEPLTTARMTPPAGIQVIGPLRPSLDTTPPGAEAPPVPLEKASAVPEAPSGTETATQPEAAEPMVKSSPEPAPQPAAEAPVSQPGAESPATEAPAEASPAAESRKPVEGVQSCRIIVSPFPNFTVLIKFDEVLKKLPEIQRLRSRSFRAGRLEVALDCDSQRSLVESLERNTEVPLHLVSETGDTLVFNLSDTQIPAPR